MSRLKRSSHLSRLSELVDHKVAAMPERGDEQGTVLVDPSLCRMNDLHRRKEIVGPALDSMVASMKASGQILPAKGWEIDGDTDDGCRYILIYGARRRAAAEAAGLKLRVEIVKQPSAVELIRMMYGENSEREDYAPYERGLELQAYLDTGAASTVTELSEMLGEVRTTVARYCQVASLPEVVVSCFPSLSDLTLKRGTVLAGAIKSDSAARTRLMAMAEEWRQKGRTGDPYAEMVSAVKGGRVARVQTVELKSRNHVLGWVDGLDDSRKLLTIRLARNAPEAFREDVLGVLRKHFPGAGV